MIFVFFNIKYIFLTFRKTDLQIFMKIKIYDNLNLIKNINIIYYSTENRKEFYSIEITTFLYLMPSLH